MINQLEELLARPKARLAEEDRWLLDIAHRNALRLLRLVNTLLDFSRVEAGRIQANFEPLDLARLTAELASNFRSACQRAGLLLAIDCAPITKPAYVDREMWEKVVLNLLSNAFKFTLEGRIDVTMREDSNDVSLTVRDTGVGIPKAELPRVFERFHRIEGQQGRTHEGTGIGLAPVQELVHLHGGDILVHSEVGRGTEFRITIPLGSSHLPLERIRQPSGLASTAIAADAFVEEALRWLHGEAGETIPSEAAIEDAGLAPLQQPTPEHARVLLADDNADMRSYIVRLLSSRWEVEAVADGLAALESARRRTPDLLLTDIMMPRLDGLGLMSAWRADPGLRDVPVILLSARAGEEAKVEGLDAGADDYLVKPFSARELIARVGSHLALARLRSKERAALRAGEEQARQHQQALRHLNENLELRVTQRRAQLGEANERLRAEIDERARVEARLQSLRSELHHAARLSAMGQMAGALAHELNHPLGAVTNFVNAARRLLNEDHSSIDLVRQHMEDAAAQSMRAGTIIHKLRNFVGRADAEKQAEDLATLVEEARALACVGPAAEGVDLRFRLDPSAREVLADRIQIEQVLVKLMRNALEAMQESKRRVLEVTTARSDANTIEISIADSGRGLAPEVLGSLFKPFTSTKRDGMGLGLSICRTLVEAHGGQITGEQNEAGGATFRFSLVASREHMDGHDGRACRARRRMTSRAFADRWRPCCNRPALRPMDIRPRWRSLTPYRGFPRAACCSMSGWLA